MDYLKLYSMVGAVMCVAACGAVSQPLEPAAVSATVEEVPQRPMTLKNSYHLGLFPFHKGEPFVVDPNVGSIDFNTKAPPSSQRSEEYYDYDTKLEEVPYDYKGDPIDRKDVVEPNFPRPNDIKSNNNNKVKQTDIYKFLNLPKNYNSSDKFPLISSSYANTKVQGSGPSSLNNHKMSQISSPTSAGGTSSWHNAVHQTTAVNKPAVITTLRPTTIPTTTSTTTTTTTTTTTAATPSQEYEDDYYDYFHPQEPAVSGGNNVAATTSTTNPTTIIHHNLSSVVVTPVLTTIVPTTMTTTTPLPTTNSAVASSTTTIANRQYTDPLAVLNKTIVVAATAAATTATTTIRPEIDSKLDGTSFADYDTIKSTEKLHQEYNRFKPLPGNYQFDEKTYPLITNSKVPMTFTAHVSSGISLNQKELSSNMKSPAVASEYPSRPTQSEIQDTSKPLQETNYDNSKFAFSGKPDATRNPPESSATHLKPRPSKPSETDQYETVYYKVKPDTQQFFPSTVPNRPVVVNSPVQSHPYQPESPLVKTSQADINRKPANTELQTSQGRPVQLELYTKTKPQQYTAPPQSQQPDTSKFKPPKHVINHFIKTQPNDDNKSYALQTSFSIGMDGERTETRPAQGIGQVLMIEDGSSEPVVNQTTLMKSKPTTSIPLVPPPRLVQKPQSYSKPQWENAPKPPPYYPPPKRDNNVQSSPPLQRPNLPNILPQFRPNAKVDAPTAPQPHAATIERVQIPIDHLRPPPLPKPQFLKLERNDENVDEEILDIPEKETRILQRTGPQPAKVTTLQMIQHGVSTKIRDDHNKDNRVHIVYAANSPPKPSEKLTDDSVLLDGKDRSDVPILKTKTNVNNKPVKTDFPYQIIKPEENQNVSSLEYKAYSPAKSDTIKPVNNQELVPNLQDYNPIVTRNPASSNFVIAQKPITATLKTFEDNHKIPADDGRKPLLQNFQIPFQPSLKLPENSNGWSVVRKPQIDSVSERIDEAGDTAASTEKFDPDNFKPQLVGGFMPINSPLEEIKEKKPIEQPERAK